MQRGTQMRSMRMLLGVRADYHLWWVNAHLDVAQSANKEAADFLSLKEVEDRLSHLRQTNPEVARLNKVVSEELDKCSRHRVKTSRLLDRLDSTR